MDTHISSCIILPPHGIRRLLSWRWWRFQYRRHTTDCTVCGRPVPQLRHRDRTSGYYWLDGRFQNLCDRHP